MGTATTSRSSPQQERVDAPPLRTGPTAPGTDDPQTGIAVPDATDTISNWTLRIYSPAAEYASSEISIYITDTMTTQRLQQCIEQAILDDPILRHETQIDTDYLHPLDIVGLFCLSDNGIFYHLDHILQIPEKSRKARWSVVRPRRRPAPPKMPWWQTIEFLVVMGILVSAWWWYADPHIWIWDNLVSTTTFLFETVVNVPLREFYRHGPPYLGGWEGAPLPSICARITYHGDEVFWSRNLEECQRIFAAKQEANLRVVRPLIYVGLLVGFVYIVRDLVREHARNRRVAPNRDMVETYQAFQMIMRQLKRAMHHQR